MSGNNATTTTNATANTNNDSNLISSSASKKILGGSTGNKSFLLGPLPPVPIPPTASASSYDYRHHSLPPPPKFVVGGAITAVAAAVTSSSRVVASGTLPPPPKAAVTISRSLPSRATAASAVPSIAKGAPTTTTTTTTTKYHPLLALRQSSLPILVIGTSTATECFAQSKNYSSLAQLFQRIADNMAAASGTSAITPIPFRSIHRTVQLELFHSSSSSSNSNAVNSTTTTDSPQPISPKVSISVRFIDRDMMDSRQQPIADTDVLLKAAGGAFSHEHQQDLSMTQVTDLLQNIYLSHCKEKQHRKQTLAGLQQQLLSTNDSAIIDNDDDDKKKQRQLINLLNTKLTAMPDLPFMKQTRLVYDELTDFTTHEMFHCPLVILLVASSLEDYSENMQELLQFHLPKAYTNGQFDPSDYIAGHGGAKRYILLLHNNYNSNNLSAAETTSFDEVIAKQRLQNLFPSIDCTVLSLSENNNNKQLSSFILQMTRDGCIPTLERRIVYLNAVVSNAKKGVKNVFKQFWRKPKTADNAGVTSTFPTALSTLLGANTDTTSNYYNTTTSTASSVSSTHGTTNGVPYRYDTVESQSRLLADSLFLIKDYDTSLSFYRLVKDDFKMDKAMVYYASIQEMIAICIYAMDNNYYSTTTIMPQNGKYSREIHYAIENALYSYTRAADEEQQQQQYTTNNRGSSSSSSTLPSRPQTSTLATRLATRLCFVLSQITPTTTLTPQKLTEVADLLASASSHETPLGAAILLEQASRHYLAALYLNKYAFHMLMSGHMYRSCRLERHAARCFTASLSVYLLSDNWKELVDHLQSALAQQLYSTEYHSLALLMYIQLMDGDTGGKISSKNLAKFSNQILDICKSKPAEARVSARLLRDIVLHKNDDVSSSFLLEDIDNNNNSIPRDDSIMMHLELCNLDLPRINDNTVEVIDMSSIIIKRNTRTTKVDEDHGGASLSSSLVKQGTVGEEVLETTDNNIRSSSEEEENSLVILQQLVGSDQVWIEMTNIMDAELRALDATATATSNGVVAVSADAVLSSLRQVEIDTRALERKTTQGASEKAHKHHLHSKSSRACEEPLMVTVAIANPLDIQLQLTEIQLVAELKMSVGKTTIFGTNLVTEDPSTLDSSRDMTFSSKNIAAKTWTYDCCPNINFKVPAFYNSTSSNSDGSSSTFEEEETEDRSPFFCVEVKDVTSMDASSIQKMTLAICPLVEGEFNILGLRCKIFDRVWVYHHFCLKGSLLQDSRQHKANRVRGTRSLLESIITRKMPLLHVDVKLDAADYDITSTGSCSSTTTMLQGEVSMGHFCIRNVGKASAHRMFLKTNTPWICLLKQPDESSLEKLSLERMATSNCVGPSGTLMQLLPFNGVLKPGDSVNVAFQLKASGGGKRELYCLFSYECFEQHPKSTAPYSLKNNNVRTVKKLLDLLVYPSLTVTASIIPSFCEKEESILSLELTNCRSDRQDQLDLALNQVFICSRFYRACKLEDSLEQPVPSLEIDWQERVVLHYRLVPSIQDDDGGCIMSECEKITTNHADGGIHNFACIEHAHDTFNLYAASYRRRHARQSQQNQTEIRDIAQIRRDKSKLPSSTSSVNLLLSEDSAMSSRSTSTVNSTSSLAGGEGVNEALLQEGTSLTSLCNPLDPHIINVICKWHGVSCKTGQHNLVVGMHHILHLPVHLPPSRERRLPGAACPLTITSKYKANVHHDFSLGAANIPFEVTVRNKITPPSKDSAQDTSEGSMSAVEFDFAVIEQTEYDLVGAQSFRWKLIGGEDISIPMNAIISSGGMYNLQCIRLTIYERGGEEMSYLFPMQWIVHIQSLL